MNSRAAVIALSVAFAQGSLAEEAKLAAVKQQPAPASQASQANIQATKTKLTQARARLAELRAEREAALAAAAEPVEFNFEQARRAALPEDPIRADAAERTKTPRARPAESEKH